MTSKPHFRPNAVRSRKRTGRSCGLQPHTRPPTPHPTQVTDNVVAGDMLVLVGDFNCRAGSDAINVIDDAAGGAFKLVAFGSAFGGVDLMFISGGAQQLASWREVSGYPSDHTLVAAVFEGPTVPSLSPTTQETCAPEGWVGYDLVTCGACSALVKVLDNGGTCEGFCLLQGLACVEGWDDETEEECSPEARGVLEARGIPSCSYNFPDTSDAVCSCTRGDRRLVDIGMPSPSLSVKQAEQKGVVMLPIAIAASAACCGLLLGGVATLLAMRHRLTSQPTKTHATSCSERTISRNPV